MDQPDVEKRGSPSSHKLLLCLQVLSQPHSCGYRSMPGCCNPLVTTRQVPSAQLNPALCSCLIFQFSQNSHLESLQYQESVLNKQNSFVPKVIASILKYLLYTSNSSKSTLHVHSFNLHSIHEMSFILIPILQRRKLSDTAIYLDNIISKRQTVSVVVKTFWHPRSPTSICYLSRSDISIPIFIQEK